ncbi:hypothetical protein P6F26_08030 [Roseibacterium sp. SDUM158017]|uniref:hypothetical protein n=1 Tax=Roseicyclus salinarum TaxID=3036773 RepID=UPI00241521B4|nr:hypothetical protein [Roseibacterium sp. SDUM158017]MDG4648391.1 hypothetical protein [Roseibacterium sp. SDUM158017]
MARLRKKPRARRRHGATLAAAVALALPAALGAQEEVWQPAIHCAALDFTRAEMLEALGEDAPPRAGTPQGAELGGRTYLRIAAEAMGCPSTAQLETMLAAVKVGIAHRIELAADYGHGPEVTVLPLASESELVCRLHVDAALLATARAAEEASPPAALCPGSG